MRIVLLYNESLSTHLIYGRFIKENASLFTEVIQFPDIPDTKNKDRLLKKIKEASLWYIFFNVITIKVFGLVNGLFGRSIQQIAANSGIPVRKLKKMDADFYASLASLNPDYVINATGNIVGKSLISIPKYGVLNFHCAPLPEFRGAANYFWLLIENAGTACGTLHYVDTGLDTGEVIGFSEKVEISRNMSVYALWKQLRSSAYPVYMRQLEYFQKGERIPSIKQNEELASYHSFPGKNDVKKLFANGYRVINLSELFEVVSLKVIRKS